MALVASAVVNNFRKQGIMTPKTIQALQSLIRRDSELAELLKAADDLEATAHLSNFTRGADKS